MGSWSLSSDVLRAGVTIHDWGRALSLCKVDGVFPVVDNDFVSLKSHVPQNVVEKGGGHLSPHELYCFVGGHKFTTGLTRHRGLHVYYRTPVDKIGKQARATFR